MTDSVKLAAFLETRCTDCHSEHKGQPIVLRAQERCSDCHGDIERVALDAKSQDVIDFKSAHPQFRVSLPDPADPKVIRTLRGKGYMLADAVNGSDSA